MVFSGLRVAMLRSPRRSRLARFILYVACGILCCPVHTLADASAPRCGDSLVALAILQRLKKMSERVAMCIQKGLTSAPIDMCGKCDLPSFIGTCTVSDPGAPLQPFGPFRRFVELMLPGQRLGQRLGSVVEELMTCDVNKLSQGPGLTPVALCLRWISMLNPGGMPSSQVVVGVGSNHKLSGVLFHCAIGAAIDIERLCREPS